MPDPCLPSISKGAKGTVCQSVRARHAIPLQVFSIGEEVKETNDSGFLGTVPTLHTQLLADNSLLQVCMGVVS